MRDQFVPESAEQQHDIFHLTPQMQEDAEQAAWLANWREQSERDRHIRDFSMIGTASALSIIGIVGVRSGTFSPIVTYALILVSAILLARVAPTVLRRS